MSHGCNQEVGNVDRDLSTTDSVCSSVAGSETTASSLASLTNFLLRNPRCFQKVKDEIRARFDSEEEITLSATLDDLPYMNACLEEGLRIFPPAPIGFLRTIQPEGDIIDGHAVPGGVSLGPWWLRSRRAANDWSQTAVSVSTWCASHSKDNFEDPDTFIPERWVDDRYKNDRKSASRPFSLGPRGCIGKE